jgi:hypothetical protein
VPIIFVWCRGSQQCGAGPQAHKRATHVLLCWCRRRSRRVHACQGRRAEQRRCRGDEDTRARRRPAEWIGPSPRVKLTSPRSPRAEPPGHRRCDHGEWRSQEKKLAGATSNDRPNQNESHTNSHIHTLQLCKFYAKFKDLASNLNNKDTN